MSKSLLFSLMLLLPLKSAAQMDCKWKVEAEAGVSCSILDADVSNLIGSSYKVRPGFASGIGVEYNVYDRIAVGTGLRFIQRDYLFQKTGEEGRNTRYGNNFISVPLTMGYYLFHNPYQEKGFFVKVQAGVFYDYFVSMHTTGHYPVYVQEGAANNSTAYLKYSATYDFGTNDNHLRRSLWGAEGGVRAGYSLGRIDVFASYSYHYGFSHIYQEKSHSAKTTRRCSSVITVGAAYKF